MINKKILILGSSGMLGHTLYSFFITKKINVITLNSNFRVKQDNLFILKKFFYKMKPDFVINCIGWIKQKKKQNFFDIFFINSILPKKISYWAEEMNFKFIHFSTDCVFSGVRGNYSEKDSPDAEDIYGYSKLLGEVKNKHSMTIRCSIIGHEIQSKNGLLEWFLSKKKVSGFTRVIFTGLTTLELGKIILKIINKKIYNNIIHISSSPISKYKLLNIIKKVYNRKIKIIKCSYPKINRSLVSIFFKKKVKYNFPSWDKMIQDMYNFKLNVT